METKVTAPRSRRSHRGDTPKEIYVESQTRISSDENIKESSVSNGHSLRSQVASSVERFDVAVNEKISQTTSCVSSPPSATSIGGRGSDRCDDGPDSSLAADYKPSPLRTWYLGSTLLVITLLLCLTVVARQTLSDGIKTFAPAVQIETNGNISTRDIGVHVDPDNEQPLPRSVHQTHYSDASSTNDVDRVKVTKRVPRPNIPTGTYASIGSVTVHPRGRPNPFTLPNPHTLPTWAPRSLHHGINPSAIETELVVGTAQPTSTPKPLELRRSAQSDHGFPQDRYLRGTLQHLNDKKSSDVVAAASVATPVVEIGHSKRDTSSPMTDSPLESPQAAETTETFSDSSSATPTAIPPQSSSNSSNSSDSESSPPSEQLLEVYYITPSEYFTGLILPTYLTTLLAIPLRSIEFNYKLYRPFHNLLHSKGATATSSLFLPTTGLSSFFVDRDITTCSTIALLALSSVLIPISAEAIHLNLHGGGCHSGQGNFDNCAMTLGVNPTFANLVMAILPLMGALIILTWTRLRRYRTAVPVKPWSVSFMEKFASDPMVSSMLSRLHQSKGSTDKKNHVRIFDPWTYTIESDGCRVVVLDQSGPEKKMSTQTLDSEKSRDSRARASKPYSFILTLWGRMLIVLILLATLLTVVVYTQNKEANGFESFMDSENIGVRILFSSTGVALTILWTSFFQAVAWISPYRVAGKAKVKTQRILDLSPPTNPFSGFYRVVSGRHPDAYLGIVSFVSILSHMLPALLVNVPYKVVDTLPYFLSCLWLVVGMVSVMICTIIGSFFVTFPHMSIDPTTVAGAMYYAMAGRTF